MTTMPKGKRRDPPLVTVRFRAGQAPNYGPDATADHKAQFPADWDALEALFPGLRLVPLFGFVDPAALQAVIDRGRRLTPGYQPARFLDMFQVKLPAMGAWSAAAPRPPALGRGLYALMLQHLPVDRVTIEMLELEPAVSDGLAGSGAPEMHHLHAAPKGLWVEAVWNLTGGQGQGEVLAVVDRGWKLKHADFVDAACTLALKMLPGGEHDPTEVNHGTMALGVAVARNNNTYGLGVAPLASKGFLSSENRSVASGADTLAAALYEAIGALITAPPGGVLLIEMDLQLASLVPAVPGVPDIRGPVEAKEEVFETIQLAVANHIVVVEPAGNGGSSGPGLDLAHPGLLHGDSGAILVGRAAWQPTFDAASDVPGGHHRPADHRVYGTRIDCFAWGDKVWAAAVLPADTVAGVAEFKDDSTSGFGGTSAASAMIAGAALVVQGMARASGAYLPPMQMRALLGDRTPYKNTPARLEATATAPATDAYDHIGVMPNLAYAAQQLGVLPDLYIRDHVDDDGQAHELALSRSPDIILRTTALGVSPDEAFGESSGTAALDGLSEAPVHTQPASIYVRVRNRGGVAATGAEVRVYWAASGTLLQPWRWLGNEIGHTVVDVPVGDTFVVAGPIPWPAVPAPGHSCLVATVDHPKDPIFVPSRLWDLTEFGAFMRRENNIAFRNFHVVELPADPAAGIDPLEADVAGAQEVEDEEMELQVDAQLPGEATVEVELPEGLADRMSLPEDVYARNPRTLALRGRIRSNGLTRLGLVRLPRRALFRVKLHVRLPPSHTGRAFQVALIQLHHGRELGRVSWRLAPAGPTHT
jgi:hypothetical protein